jgi:hypothetical protein
MKKPLKYAIASSLIFLTGCVNSTTPAIATETGAEICRQIGGELPTRSRSDTPQTQNEIQRLYAIFSLACPEWEGLIP